jgi:radical SAM superfamily enzyme YgiQ (UPF0313 family)
MKKPSLQSYNRFAQQFRCASQAAGKEQTLLPYFISGHPGSTLHDTIAMALYLKRHNLRPLRVQDFIPTPMSVAATMYHTGLDPLSKGAARPVYVAKELRERKLQRALLLYWDRGHHELAREALRKAGRQDLIGYGPGCLVPPEPRLPAPPKPHGEVAPPPQEASGSRQSI